MKPLGDHLFEILIKLKRVKTSISIAISQEMIIECIFKSFNVSNATETRKGRSLKSDFREKTQL